MNRLLTSFLFIGIVLTTVPFYASAQGTDIKLGIGFSSAWINGDNPARYFLYPEILQGQPADSVVVLPGGSLDGQQPGIGLRARFGLGDSSRFRMMLGADYVFYRGNWRIPLDNGSVYLHHNVDMATGILGAEYVAVEFTPIVRLYTAAELRAAYLHSTYFNWEFRTSDGSVIQQRETTAGKPSTFRLGAALRVGLEGEFEENIFVDTSVGYGAINLMGRDDVRGQLLTSNNYLETKEDIVGNILFSIILMYRI